MNIDPVQLCKYFEFDSLLPPGRLNGFVNMIQLIQLQTRRAIQLSMPQIDAKTDMEMERQSAAGLPTPDYDDGDIMDHRKSETAVLLSGGVDSSVALKLLKLKGEKVY